MQNFPPPPPQQPPYAQPARQPARRVRQPAPPGQPRPNAAARRTAAPRRRLSRGTRFVIGTAATAVVGVGMVLMLFVVLAFAPNRIASGVEVAGVALGSMTAAQAEAALGALNNSVITAADGDRRWSVSLVELGVRVDEAATLRAAERAQRGESVVPVYVIDLNQAQIGLFSLSGETNIPAIPGDPPQYGRALDVPVVLDRLRADVSGELGDGYLELDMIEVEPPREEAGSRYDGEPTTHIVEAGQELALIARQYGVTMDAIVEMNDIANPDVLYVGQQLNIPADGVYQPDEDDAPPAPSARGKAIVVSTGDQRIYAYEDGELVRSHLVSTGLPETPTVLGDYNIYVKYTATDMSGPDYYLPQVPYTMYFYQGYGIHGTYWHNSFGRPMSHGCVNLPTPEAQWFFNFAEVGTLVRVI